MTFTARIRRNSAIWQMWRQQHRVGGVVDGVAFHWIAGDDYVSSPLVPDRVPAMQRHTDVVVEGVEVMPVNPVLTEALGLRPLDDPDDVPLRTRRPARGAGRLGLS